MKKIFISFLVLFLLVSCGGDKLGVDKNEVESSTTTSLEESADTAQDGESESEVEEPTEVTEEPVDELTFKSSVAVSDALIHVSNYGSGNLDEQETVSLPSELMMILDVSGSMAGVLGDEIKMTTARKVVKNVTKTYGENTKIGFMAYGHNRTGDCSDIETLLEPSLGNADKISTLVDGLTPTGMTPMGTSVSQAVDQLSGVENASIALVTDGIETCDVNICELGKKIKDQDIDLKVHVVSFGVDKKQTANMQCLAEQTGGQFIAAQDADSLELALDSVVSASSCADYSKEKIDLYLPEKVISGSSNTIKWTRTTDARYDRIMFAKIGDEIEEFEYFYPNSHEKKLGRDEKYSQDLVAPQEPGMYQIIYLAKCGDIILQHDVEIVGAEVQIAFPSEVVSGSSNKVKWIRSTDARYDRIMFARVGDEIEEFEYFYPNSHEDKKLRDGSYAHELIAPEESGSYKVIYLTKENEEILFEQDVEVVGAEVEIVFPSEVVSGSSNKVKWTRTTDARYDRIMFAKVGDEIEEFEYFYPNSHEDKKLRDGSYAHEIVAPETPGDYKIIYLTRNNEEILAEVDVTVIAAEVNIEFPGTIKVGEKNDITWTRTTDARYDQIAIARVSDEIEIYEYFYPSSHEDKDDTEHTHQIVSPQEPGEYQIIYFTRDNEDILFNQTIIVK